MSNAVTTFEKTIHSSTTIHGIGVHSGAEVQMVLSPANPGDGITFYRSDISAEHNKITADWSNVTDTMLCTKITNPHGVSVGTIEHLMAALYACDIDNINIHISAPEVPIMDGSSAPFVDSIHAAGITAQTNPRKILQILEPVYVEESATRWVKIEPYAGFAIDCQFDFTDRSQLPTQTHILEVTSESFTQQIIKARTFGFKQDVEKLQSMGLALGGSLENALVIDGATILNRDGFRYENECVRHKILDAVGDLMLAGHRIQGKITARQSGHGLMHKLLQKIFTSPQAWETT